MENERLSGALQENILTLLCFSDSACKQIRSSIPVRLFESAVYRDIAGQAVDFIDQFGVAIKEHLPDGLEDVLKGPDSRKASLYEQTLHNLFAAKATINEEYVLRQLNKFLRQQSLKAAIITAVESLENGDIDQAELDLQDGFKNQMVSFDAGTFLSDTKRSLTFLDTVDECIHTGISELDRRDIGPRPKELFLIIAPAKRGKTWGLIHLGKFALFQRKKVLHITLEMSEERCAQRYLQSFFSISKREAAVRMPRINLDELGRLIGIGVEEVKRPSLADSDIRKVLTTRINREFSRRPPLLIKQFPTGSLTVKALEAYLDSLDRFHKFVPDMIVLDYPDLMELDPGNIRLETSQLYKKLRGVAVDRNIAMVAASQGNRDSSAAKVVTEAMVAEDYSKIATADTVVTYCQTAQEKAVGLARLFVSNVRNDEDKFQILMTQNYAVGQFCLDSAYMGSDYFDIVEQNQNPSEDDD
jgi:replicative DNA helicase